MEKVTVIGKSAGGGIIIEVSPEEGQPIKEHYRGVRCGLSWPTPYSPGYFCLVGQLSKSTATGKYPLRLLREGQEQTPGKLFQRMADDLGLFNGHEIYTDLSEKFRSYVIAFADYKRSERGVQGLRMLPAPFCQSFLHGASLIKEWMKEDELVIPKEATVYTQLREIKTDDLKSNPEEVFYAINGLRYVIGAFETSVCSPPQRRSPSPPISPGAWT
jgi:hypothetical protein